MIDDMTSQMLGRRRPQSQAHPIIIGRRLIADTMTTKASVCSSRVEIEGVNADAQHGCAKNQFADSHEYFPDGEISRSAKHSAAAMAAPWSVVNAMPRKSP